MTYFPPTNTTHNSIITNTCGPENSSTWNMGATLLPDEWSEESKPMSWLARILKVWAHHSNPPWSWLLRAAGACSWCVPEGTITHLCHHLEHSHQVEPTELHWTQMRVFSGHWDLGWFLEWLVSAVPINTASFHSEWLFLDLCLSVSSSTSLMICWLYQNWLWLNGLSLSKGLCFYFT